VKRFTWILVLPLAAVAVIFAVMNRTPVALDLWPLPWRIEAGAYLILLGSLAIGILIGLLLAWLASGARRRRMRQYVQANERQASELRNLRRQLAEAKRAAGGTPTPTAAVPLPVPGATSRAPVPLDPAASPAILTERR
jgi:uncharacterized integral membrane protein